MILKKINAKAPKSMVRGTNFNFGKRFLSGALVVTLLFPNITASRVFGENQQAPSSPQEKSESFYSKTTAKFKELYSKSKNAVKSGADLAVSKGKEAVDWAKNNPVTAGVGSVVGTGVVVGLSVLAKKRFSGNSNNSEYDALDDDDKNEDYETFDLLMYRNLAYTVKINNTTSFIETLEGRLGQQEDVVIDKADALHAVNKRGIPLLYLAIRDDKCDIVDWFFDPNNDRFTSVTHSNDVDATNGKRVSLCTCKYGQNEDTLLHIAVRLKDYKMVMKLLKNINAGTGAFATAYKLIDPDQARDMQGQTALHVAAANHDLVMCQLLIAYGTNPEIKNLNGQTIFDCAENDPDVTWLQTVAQLKLIAQPARMNKRPEDPNACVASMMASQIPPRPCTHSLATILPANDGMTEDADGSIPLLKAATNGWSQLFSWFVQNGANITYQDSRSKRNALHLAVTGTSSKDPHRDYLGIIDLLLSNPERRALLDAKDNDGNTPLHLTTNAPYGIIQLLVKKGGANLEAKNNEGYTPLHAAAEGQNLEAVKELINLGADITAQTNSGKTPLELADNDAILNYLTEKQPKKGNTGSASSVFAPNSSQRLSQKNLGSGGEPSNGDQSQPRAQSGPSYLSKQRPHSDSASPRLTSDMKDTEDEEIATQGSAVPQTRGRFDSASPRLTSDTKNTGAKRTAARQLPNPPEKNQKQRKGNAALNTVNPESHIDELRQLNGKEGGPKALLTPVKKDDDDDAAQRKPSNCITGTNTAAGLLAQEINTRFTQPGNNGPGRTANGDMTKSRREQEANNGNCASEAEWNAK